MPAAKSSAKPATKAVAAAPSVKPTKTAAQPSDSPGMVLGLGAGDSLGRAVFVNDVIIAARNAKRKSEFAEVQPKNTDGN